MGFGRVCESAYGENMVFREEGVLEGLVNFRRRASGNGLAVGGFRMGVRHGGHENCDFWLFLSRSRQAFAAPHIPRIGAFAFTREAIASGASGA